MTIHRELRDSDELPTLINRRLRARVDELEAENRRLWTRCRDAESSNQRTEKRHRKLQRRCTELEERIRQLEIEALRQRHVLHARQTREVAPPRASVRRGENGRLLIRLARA